MNSDSFHEFRSLPLRNELIFQTDFSGEIIMVAKSLDGFLWVRIAWNDSSTEPVWTKWGNIKNLNCRNPTNDELWLLCVKVMEAGEIYYCKGDYVNDIENWGFSYKDCKGMDEIWNDIKRNSNPL